MKIATQLIIAIILSVLTLTKCIRVLGLFPHPGVSHFHFFHPIMRGLAEAGHEVTVVSHFPDKSPLMHYRDLPLTGIATLNDSVDLKILDKTTFHSHFDEFFLLYDWGKEACENAIKSQAIATVLKLGKSQKYYDVILMEQFNTDCMMGVAYMLNAPVIALSSCALMPWHYKRIGNPHNPSYIPSLFLGFSEDMGFFQRIGNWITLHAMNFLYEYYSEPTATDLIRKRFGNDIPDVGELVKETSLFFVNQHYSLSGAKPLSPAVIELGGVHIQRSKPLEMEIQQLLDSAKNGAIYISWGSMIRSESLPAEKHEAIIRAIIRLKLTTFWKWENDTMPKQPSNVFIKQWMPQKEILCHPNVKVFITHGGLLGSSEAAYCGVPVVVTPIYGDQFLNAAALVHRGMGVRLNYDEITENSFFRAVRKVLEQKMQDNAKTVSYSYKNRPKKAVETAVWWVEHVAKTEGAPFLKSTSTYLSDFTYYCLDIYLFFICIIAFAIMTWYIFINILIIHLTRSRKQKKN